MRVRRLLSVASLTIPHPFSSNALTTTPRKPSNVDHQHPQPAHRRHTWELSRPPWRQGRLPDDIHGRIRRGHHVSTMFDDPTAADVSRRCMDKNGNHSPKRRCSSTGHDHRRPASGSRDSVASSENRCAFPRTDQRLPFECSRSPLQWPTSNQQNSRV